MNIPSWPMKLFHFGDPGQERRGAFDADGGARDISYVISDLRGSVLAPSNLQGLSRALLRVYDKT